MRRRRRGRRAGRGARRRLGPRARGRIAVNARVGPGTSAYVGHAQAGLRSRGAGRRWRARRISRVLSARESEPSGGGSSPGPRGRPRDSPSRRPTPWSSTRGPSSAWRSTPPGGPASWSSRAWSTCLPPRLGRRLAPDQAARPGGGHAGRPIGQPEPDRRGRAPRPARRRGRPVPRPIARPSSARFATTSAVSGSSKYYRIVHRGFDDDGPAYVDRNHEWNGLDGRRPPRIPPGADYIMPFNEDKWIKDLQMTVEVARAATLYVFFDNREETAALALRPVHRHGHRHRPRRGLQARRPVAPGPGARPEHRQHVLGLEARGGPGRVGRARRPARGRTRQGDVRDRRPARP